MSERGALVCVRTDMGRATAQPRERQRWQRRNGQATRTFTSDVPPRPDGSSRPAPPFPRVPRRGAFGAIRLAVGAVLLCGVGAGALGLLHASDSDLSRQLNLGCDEVEPCQRLEAQAQERVAQCWMWCGQAEAEHKMARLFRYRSEERRAVREHYRQREQTERAEEQSARAQKLDQWQRERAARSEEATREHERRLELERLQQAHLDRRALEQRQRRAHYYEQLGPEARAQRLKHCVPKQCDALVLDLLEATSDEQERRSLVELNERLLRGEGRETPAPPTALPASGTAPSTPPNARHATSS